MRVLAIFSASYSLAVWAAVYGGLDRFLLRLGLLCCGVAVVLGVLLRSVPKRRRMAVLIAAGAAVGFLWTAGYQQIFVEPARALDQRTVMLRAQVKSWPEEGENGWSVVVSAETEGRVRVDTLLYLDEQGANLCPGDNISTVTRCSFADRTFSGEEITYYTAKGIFLRGKAYGTLTVERPERQPISVLPAFLAKRVEEHILNAFPEGKGDGVLAIVTGNRNNLTQPFTSSLQRTGLSHTVAVSGMHLAFLASALSMVLGKYRRRTSLVVIPASLLFMVMAGCTPSVVRATVMVIMLMAAPLFQRERDDATALGAALLMLLVQNPLAVTHVGLQLSFGAVAGIFLTAEPIWEWLQEKLHLKNGKPLTLKWLIWLVPNYIGATLASTLGAQVFTLPLCALHFSSVSLLSPLANLLTLWCVALLFGGGLLIGVVGLFWDEGTKLLASLLLPAVEYLDWSVGELSSVPFTALTLDAFSYQLWTILLSFAILFVLIKRSRPALWSACATCGAALVLAMGFAALEFYLGPMRVTMLDVGQGQSVLLRQGSFLTVVDCGGSSYDNAGDLAANHIQNVGRRRIDLLILTHFHADHANGVPQLLERLQVGRMMIPDGEEDDPLRAEILELAQEKGIEILTVTDKTCLELEEGNRVEVFPPLGDREENERGLSVLASCGEFDLLVTGDMSGEVELLLLEYAELPDLELLAVGHHGSKYSTSEELLETTEPETVLISVGKDNYYGHPAPELLERLGEREIYRTDRDGTITVTVTRRGSLTE